MEETRSENLPKMVLVPREQLSQEALDGLISEFILREGTDYGRNEYTLQQKQEQVVRQLEKGYAFVVFDTEEQSCSIVRKEDLPHDV